jgi:hypothetical protein
VRAAADTVALRRQTLIGGFVTASTPGSASAPTAAPPSIACQRVEKPAAAALKPKPLGFEDGNYSSGTKLGNYRPFRHRSGTNRAIPPGAKRGLGNAKGTADGR